jgi:hypothetical protein
MTLRALAGKITNFCMPALCNLQLKGAGFPECKAIVQRCRRNMRLQQGKNGISFHLNTKKRL